MPALEIAAPSPATDELAPWVGPRDAGQTALAATFWAAFGGLSTMAHGLALGFTFAAVLVPIPFVSSMCGAAVKPVERRVERVEVALVVAPPAPAPEPLLERVHGDSVDVVSKTASFVGGGTIQSSWPSKKPKKAKAKPKQEASLALLGILGGEGSGSFTSALVGDADVLGGLIAIDEAATASGLGLGGISDAIVVEGGVAGGVTGSVLDKRPAEVPDLDEATIVLEGGNARDAARVQDAADACDLRAETHAVLEVAAGRTTAVTTTPASPCLERRLRNGTWSLSDGAHPLVIKPW